jgi:hypothetical protein
MTRTELILGPATLSQFTIHLVHYEIHIYFVAGAGVMVGLLQHFVRLWFCA